MGPPARAANAAPATPRWGRGGNNLGTQDQLFEDEGEDEEGCVY